jgi:D-alanyl-D-alanine carboxypeptidase/D-alanyl-D-alanine-endopeptidase (penicillin-binding protein 4)
MGMLCRNNLKTQKAWIRFGVCALAISLSANIAWGAKMRAKCYLLDKDEQTVEGVDIHRAYEIASVSKIFTSYWATAVRGVDYRFKTKIDVTPVSEGVVNLHIEGGWDPYFNRDEMQYLLAQLSAMNVRRINELSFDENFKFMIDSRGVIHSSVPIGHYQLEDPTPARVEQNLKNFVATGITSGYAALRVKAKSISQIALPATLKIRIGSVRYLSNADFQLQQQQAGVIQGSRQLEMLSIPLNQILKEMNRNSNNYVANLVFQSMGGAAEFKKFAMRTLETDPMEIQFVNGSGDRLDLPNGKSTYNKASCDAIVKTIAQFRATLKEQHSQLEQIMALAGEDASTREASTVSRMYGSEATTDALIAKTGTVNPAVTLAGMASTEDGDVYFGIVYGTNGRKSDWSAARLKIRKDVIALFQKFGNKKEIDYDASQFLTFDKDSHLRDITSSSGRPVKAALPPPFETSGVGSNPLRGVRLP